MKLNLSTKSKIFFIILLLMILSFQVCSQRGGGSRSRSSRSSSRSYSSRRTSRNSSTQQPWQTWQIVVLIPIVCGILILSYLKVNKQKYQISKRQTRRITDGYEQKNQQNVCILDQDQRNKAIDWFMSNIWTVQFKSDNNNNGFFNIKITDIVKRTDYVYEIQALGENDALGESDMKGILLFQNSYLSICFDKVYNDREKAGQTGKWSVLVYEGVQQGEIFAGRWYFEGFEGDSEYSGEMSLVHN